MISSNCTINGTISSADWAANWSNFLLKSPQCNDQNIYRCNVSLLGCDAEMMAIWYYLKKKTASTFFLIVSSWLS